MQTTLEFQEQVWEYYGAHGRHDLPWRQPKHAKPYDITVSELMLQQTQVARVIPKFVDFLAQFPDVDSLATAELGDVLRAWQGLGYNRRAKYLWQTAQMVRDSFGGTFPDTSEGLQQLPGIGVNTAGAILAYAYDLPAVFVETNIRTVYIHHFFASETTVTDTMIREKLAQTVPEHESIREWYWALMDYGTYLKQTVGNLNKLSKSYTKQSKFQGSRRQVRGAILRMLSMGAQTRSDLAETIMDDRLDSVLQELIRENLVKCSNNNYYL